MAARIRIGIVGLGAAGRAFLPAIRGHAAFELAAVAEPVAETRAAIANETGTKGFADLPSMLSGAALDAVYIATPTELHAEHAAMTFTAKKHVLTEKPMAIRMDQGQAMIEAADRAGVVLLAGHSHSYDLPIKTMREIVAGGSLGRLRMIHTWNFTDWIYRPRRPDELDISLGGGVTFRQGSHQFDIIRLLGGGLVKSVHATTFDWDAARRSIGAHTVFMQFADGAAATAVYNGYGYFSTMELIDNVTEWGFTEPIEQRPLVQRSAGSAADELAAKRKRAGSAIPTSAPHQPHFGITLVSCEHGDIRQSPDGLYVYSDKGREAVALPNNSSPRDLVLDEFAAAINGTSSPIHDGRWGLANLEICLAAIESSKNGKVIELKHQVPVSGTRSFRGASVSERTRNP
jgi:phthalate 4,5-cis-dihydrodiol dehydrogenase